MNENLNLIELLKDCPKGTKLYSTVYGEVKFDGIENGSEYPVRFVKSDGYIGSVTAQGLVLACYDGECIIFPSREQRDWGKFKHLVKPKFKVGDKIVNIHGKLMGASGSYGIISEITDDKYFFTDSSYAFIRNQDSWELVPDKKPKFDPETLRPFDKVLVRDTNEGRWKCTLFSHIIGKEDSVFRYVTLGSFYIYCIPYNNNTKHLVGTADEAAEYYRYWED